MAPKGISPRECEVISLVALGLTNKEIARLLSITPITVKHHISHLLCKLDADNRLQLAVFAIEHGLLHSPSLLLPTPRKTAFVHPQLKTIE